jgi:S-adenosylmethionine:tRNA ribosyltransferase-isomerase
VTAPFSFTLPPELAAHEPPERRGTPRDHVRLLVTGRRTGALTHSRFDQLGDFLRRGDLLVFNSSRTLPASLHGCQAPVGPCMEVRLAQQLPDGHWLALLLCERGDPFGCGLREGMEIDFGKGLKARVFDRDGEVPRLWHLKFGKEGDALLQALYEVGQPIRYEHVSAPFDLDYYQTVYAREPGSAEMPSAGRAFTWKLLFDLRRRGVDTAYVVLHTGLSSYMDDEVDRLHLPFGEEYFITASTAQKVNRTRAVSGRVIAVGTTVVKALETVADAAGQVHPGHGYTKLHVTADHRLRAVDGLLTGLHEPEASHLDLLAAFLPSSALRAGYEEAVRQGYLWHEFGDLNLIV